jgi:methionyl-tRNA formyltransferase
MLRVTLLCSDPCHPVINVLKKWQKVNKPDYQIDLFTSINEVNQHGDILFLVSCTEIINKSQRGMFNHVLVLHASDLPNNRGWSPHIWAVVNGDSKLTVSLLEAEDKVDTGRIWKKMDIQLDGSELYDEINEKLFDSELQLISWACQNMNTVEPQKQENIKSNYLRQRTPNDSEIDIEKSLKEQFNQLRVCDPERYPAYFYLNNCKYKLKVEKY